MNAPEITMIDPTDVIADSNIRFGLKKDRIAHLVSLIERDGQINDPIEVEELAEPVDGKHYRVTVGHYRTAAAEQINANGGDILLPAIVRKLSSDTARLIRQVSENNDRESLSLMDKAIAIDKMKAAGVPMIDIRKAFASPVGKKNVKLEMASNALINMIHGFLKFPKPIQNKLHNGDLTMGAAYELSKKSEDLWPTILAKAEEEMLKRYERETKDEESYLKSTSKAVKAEKDAADATTSLEKAKAATEVKEKELQAAVEAAALALNAKVGKSGDEKKKAEEAYKAATKAVDETDKALTAAKKELDKLSGKATTAVQTAKEKLAAAQKASADKKAKAASGKGGKAVGVKDVKKAAAATPGSAKGKDSAPVALNAVDMRACIETLSKPGGRPKVQQIGALIKACFAGEFAPSALGKKLGEVTGEK